MSPDETTQNITLGEMYTDAYAYIHCFIALFKTGNCEQNIKYLPATLRDRAVEMLKRIMD